MKKFAPFIVALGVAALGYLAYRLLSGGQSVEGGATNAELSAEIKAPAANAPDFGPIEDKYIMGKTPGGPGAPGSAPTAPKGGK